MGDRVPTIVYGIAVSYLHEWKAGRRGREGPLPGVWLRTYSPESLKM